MTTVAELETRLEALKAQRDSAVARVSYDGRTVEYRGTAEIARAIAEVERELQALQGKAPVRQIRVYTSKGLWALSLLSNSTKIWASRTAGRFDRASGGRSRHRGCRQTARSGCGLNQDLDAPVLCPTRRGSVVGTRLHLAAAGGAHPGRTDSVRCSPRRCGTSDWWFQPIGAVAMRPAQPDQREDSPGNIHRILCGS